MWTIGLDVHWKQSSVCILDANGKKIKAFTIHGPWSRVIAALGKIDRPFAVCFEASCGYGYLYEALSQMASRVVVAHPGRLRLIFRSSRKTDRVDAEKLAKLLYLDEVPSAYVPSTSIRRWREMIEYRQALIGKRTRCKNGLRALLRSRGLAAPRGLWTRAGVAWLTTAALGDALASLRRDMLLEELSVLDRQVGRVTKALDQVARRESSVGLLQTIPGVGPRTAEAVAAYVADADRFGHSRQVGAYLGLVPREDSSAGVQRLGHITREGPSTVRKLLVEAAWQAIRRSAGVRARFERLTHGRSDRRKIAAVGVAHHLARCMVSMLKTGELWREAA
jgi:transposase